jgi:hypothetical protein
LNKCKSINRHKSQDHLNRYRKGLEQNTTSIYDKTLKKLGMEGTYLNITKAIYNPIANIVLTGEKLKVFSLKLGMRQGCPFSLLLILYFNS